MFRYLAAARRILSLGTVLCLTAFAGPGYAALADLEGTQGHAPTDSLSALEGDAGHAGAAAPDDGIVCQPGAQIGRASCRERV